MHIAQRNPLATLAPAQIQVFAVHPPLGLERLRYLVQRVPAIEAVEVDGLAVTGDGIAHFPHHPVGVAVQVLHRLLQEVHGRAVVGEDGFKIVLSLIQPAEKQVFRIMFPSVELHVVGVLLLVRLSGTILLLYLEGLSVHPYVVAHGQDEELPGGEVYRDGVLHAYLLRPLRGRVRTYRLFYFSCYIIDDQLHFKRYLIIVRRLFKCLVPARGTSP
ncbi:hypothetical protein [Phocaeicola massiliensis]|uniref:hypothetical protein n=1 Tax=Phocaeicola massiliensis TaxID=204516 RepID=UPI00215BE0B6|nr:hypothetical protein [Phocaeicola massiliensis]